MKEEAAGRKYWRASWRDAISSFGDVETQRRRWFDPAETNPHWSFVEVMCGYFDDCSLDLGYQYWIDRKFLTVEEAAAVSHFHSLAEVYTPSSGDDFGHKSILADPTWQALCEAARESSLRLEALLLNSTD